MTEIETKPEVEIESGLIYKHQEYLEHFIQMHPKIEAKLTLGKLYGPNSKEWHNLKEHNVLAGIFGRKIGELWGLDPQSLDELTEETGTHDWSKRLERETDGKTLKIQNGVKIYTEYDKTAEMERELARVNQGTNEATGDDWRNILSWDPLKTILRYVDSSLMDTSDRKHADFVDWRERVKQLRKTREPQQEIVGNKLYGGTMLYDALYIVTWHCQNVIYKKIMTKHPEFRDDYPEPEDLTRLIKDQVIKDVEQWESNNAI